KGETCLFQFPLFSSLLSFLSIHGGRAHIAVLEWAHRSHEIHQELAQILLEGRPMVTELVAEAVPTAIAGVLVSGDQLHFGLPERPISNHSDNSVISEVSIISSSWFRVGVFPVMKFMPNEVVLRIVFLPEVDTRLEWFHAGERACQVSTEHN
ncbi:hypothetical protein PMAYCL1PPCAC_22571, partial [Pristionchus mayeri]